MASDAVVANALKDIAKAIDTQTRVLKQVDVHLSKLGAVVETLNRNYVAVNSPEENVG